MIEIPQKVKEAYQKNDTEKRMRIRFLSGCREELTNKDLIEESVVFTENLCSEETLKFGLCEANCFEFECFGNIGNIQGEQIQVTQEVDYTENGVKKTCSIPFGIFGIDSCKKTGIERRKVIAYNSLKSRFLDEDGTKKINELIEKHDAFERPSIFYLGEKFLKVFGIERELKKAKLTEFNSVSMINTVQVYTTEYFTNQAGVSTKETEYKVRIEQEVLTQISSQEKYYTFQMGEEEKEKREEGINELVRICESELKRDIDRNMLKRDIGEVIALKLSKKNPVVSKWYSYLEMKEKVATNAETIEYVFVTKITLIQGQAVKKEWNYDKEKAISTVETFEINVEGTEKLELEKITETVTLRNIFSSLYELRAEFGCINRITGEFRGAQLNNGALYPLESLYPSDSLYPNGAVMRYNKAAYTELIVEEFETKKYGKIVIQYKTLDKEKNEITETYSCVFDEQAENVYFVKDNWILNNRIFAKEEIQEIAEKMKERIKGIRFTPFEMEAVGIPYIETGDMIEFVDGEKTVKSYLMKRTLTGIKRLKDEYETRGEERNIEI